MPSGRVNRLNKILQTRISFKKIYFNLLKDLTKLYVRVNKLEGIEFIFQPKIYENPINVEFNRELIPVSVVIKSKQLDNPVEFKNSSEKIKITTPVINSCEICKSCVSWKDENLKFFNTCRNYFLAITASIKSLLNSKTPLFSNIKTRMIGSGEIYLQKKVRTTEEIIALSPYTKNLNLGEIYRIPVVKTPLNKLYFSSEEMDGFREILAKQVKSRKSNIELLSIYDRFNVDLYSNIKQDTSGKNLLCYLNPKHIKKVDMIMYYLLI